MQSFGLHYLPITFSLLVIITFIISYAMSAAFGDVSILFPYISDLGTLAPESCVFGQLLNLCSFLGCLCIYCWYGHQIERLENMGSPRSHFIFARVTLAFGLTAGLGLSVVGNFQETSVLTVHLIGALMTFGFGTLYTILISHASRAHLDSPKWLRTLRVSLAVTCSVAFVAMFLFAGLTSKGINLPHKWEPGEKGYVAHTLSVTCEWLLAVCFLSFFFTMIYDLRDYTMDPIKVRHRYANLDREVLTISA
ncbi:hypothetical protein P879_00450 [Paragonimus westermani]|uniref:CWH43-like N-terminal domain-containing protein n=1 Tax=Paragonimus westermani TaxID=34504 RepID=A0A8T0DWU9_9TREM|nr:hypothetical protein P879_00450 [Paragonimus westermani]